MNRLISHASRTVLATTFVFSHVGYLLADEVAAQRTGPPTNPRLGRPRHAWRIGHRHGARRTPTLLRGKDAQQQLVVNGQYSSGTGPGFDKAGEL